MKVEIFRKEKLLITMHLKNWCNFENYMMRWLTALVSINIQFQSLEEMTLHYEDVLEMVECVQLAQNRPDSYNSAYWEVSIIHPFGEVLKFFPCTIASSN